MPVGVKIKKRFIIITLVKLFWHNYTTIGITLVNFARKYATMIFYDKKVYYSDTTIGITSVRIMKCAYSNINCTRKSFIMLKPYLIFASLYFVSVDLGPVL